MDGGGGSKVPVVLRGWLNVHIFSPVGRGKMLKKYPRGLWMTGLTSFSEETLKLVEIFDISIDTYNFRVDSRYIAMTFQDILSPSK